jgi:hypothetical protein
MQQANLDTLLPGGESQVSYTAQIFQSDQIGRIFSYWAMVYCGQFFYYGNVWRLLFSSVKVRHYFLQKMCWATYLLGDFFTNSSGHPGYIISYVTAFSALEIVFAAAYIISDCKRPFPLKSMYRSLLSLS